MIIAVDFDGTLCEDRFPQIGKAKKNVIAKLIQRKQLGDKLILWSCRDEDKLEEAISWCGAYGLYFDSVNQNVDEVIKSIGRDSRKIIADIYLDDRSVNPNEKCDW